MHIILKFQSFFRTLTGVDQEILDVAEGTTIQGLTSLLAERFQNLPLEDERTRFFINGQVPTHNQVLEEGDRVLIFQLVAGG
ncbi:MAG: MoaD/ThiS family protein [Deltaproteobacteria bacterium]|nr:MoaD/ThiS family protein [Deltaproteobacteria bacterium]